MAVKRYKGDGYALYGSVCLPSFDRFEAVFNEELANGSISSISSSFANYTYRFAMTNPDSPGDVFIHCLTHPLYVDESGEIWVPQDTAFCGFTHYSWADGGELYEVLTGDWLIDNWWSHDMGTGINLNDGWQIVWSNFDATIQTDSGEYVFTASEPIPFDGMNVIEWDGDTSEGWNDGEGIYENGDGSFIVARDVPKATNAIAVFGGKLCTEFSDDPPEWAVYDNNEDSDWNGNIVARRAEYTSGWCVDAYWYDEEHYTNLIAYTPAEEPSTVDYTISYSTAHGTAPSAKTVTVNEGESYTLTSADLPTLSASGYTFNGWLLNGSLAKAGDTISANATLVAVWEKEVTDFDWDSFVKGYKVGAALRRKRRLPVAYLYNGVRLPNIGSVWTDKAAKPYATIGVNGSTYRLSIGSTALTVSANGTAALTGTSLTGTAYDLVDNLWVKGSSSTKSYKVIWANYNVLYGGAAGDLEGNVYLQASEPVPVYE